MGPDHLTDAKFRQCFNSMRLSGEMCDVDIVVEGREFSAHKLILSGCSPYFRGMFRAGNFDESSSQRISIDPKGELGIRAEAVGKLRPSYSDRRWTRVGDFWIYPTCSLLRVLEVLEL